MSRFFIALLPPQHIQDYANEIKQHFADHYASRGAQKSPPHITLQPPFEWSDAHVPQLETAIRDFAHSQQPIPITLNGYAAFPPRVIYINVVKSQELLTLQADLMADVESNLEIVDKTSQTRPFTPHLTVAFRDLTKQNFRLAWPEFVQRSLNFYFTADKLTLLLHDGKRWNIKSEFAFCSNF
ncbi:2'-5' RNA ligase family protein [Nodularia spumigena CS-588/02]|uniref:2'-5' RNA ligase family protein n=1 Tax=Nodularia spumigena TaxID=70799 RepID=UPI00232E5014|nr:2'-5' RNA ligase family protein [Nodularia spumigena]MDB9321146.1 2'-5' RNA ligase family protein [Nodularia spumigena CS-591/07A]MDB9359147.1 2'-5' RNA ligase family protein [Nodularia spumigena CS-588/02]MDB9365543.1 2'-5' RNA ligase family protein [Nodularia spumigena CS-588/02A10]